MTTAPSASSPPFALGARGDEAELAARFAATGVVSIPGILADDNAAELYAMLRGRDDWRQVIGGDATLVELDRPTRAAMSEVQRGQLDQAVYAGAREGFQFRYETLRVPDSAEDRAARADPLAAFAAWWSGDEVLSLLRAITGARHITFADMQATAYAPGDFLTAHDDDVAGKNRVAAYVLNLTPNWRVEWGGLLAFHDESGPEVTALAPAFNRLNLLRVPQRHSVTEVTRAAAYRRYALTGWLRY
jgi:SM-20-related protein